MNRSEQRKKIEDCIVLKELALQKFEHIIKEELRNMVSAIEYKATIVDVTSGYVDEKVILRTYGGHKHEMDVSEMNDIAIINEITAFISGGCRMEK